MSEYKCDKCGSYKKPDPKNFKSGDKVQFMTVTEGARTTKMKSVDGCILSVDADGFASVKHKKGVSSVKNTALTHAGQPGPLTYQMFGVCRCLGE